MHFNIHPTKEWIVRHQNRAQLTDIQQINLQKKIKLTYFKDFIVKAPWA